MTSLSNDYSTSYSEGAENANTRSTASDDQSFTKRKVILTENIPPGIYRDDGSYSTSVDNDAVQQVVKSRPIFRNICDVTEGLLKSKIFRIVVDTALVGIAIGVLFALISNPVGWIATALGVSLLAAKFIFAAGAISAVALLGIIPPFPTKKTIEFELSAIRKLLTSNNYDNIPLPGLKKTGKQLYLGAIPNALKDYETMQKVVGKQGSVFALMEEWELTPQGLSIPMTQQDYTDLSIRSYSCSAPDHKIIPPGVLDKLADQINKGLKNGNVYVHCRGGAGRSAAAVAAYLMKYQSYSIEEASAVIKHNRRNSTIWNKIHGLNNYQNYIQANHKIILASLSQEARNAVVHLNQLEGAGKKPKLPKETITKLHDSAINKIQMQQQGSEEIS